MTSDVAEQPAGLGNHRPHYVTALEAAYGPPSEAGFGSSVFFVAGPGTEDLESLAKVSYERFVGKKMWERIGGEQWLGQWVEVYRRSPDGKAQGIGAELKALGDREARMQADLILDAAEKPDVAREALAQGFDAPEVTELRIYKIGDGEAMSGLLIVGRRGNGDTILLAFLMD